MSQYIDSLLQKGLTLETLYQLGVIDQVNESAFDPQVQDPDQVTIDHAAADPAGDGADPSTPSTSDLPAAAAGQQTDAAYVTIEHLNAVINELKNLMHVTNIQQQIVDKIEDHTMTVDDAITGLFYGNNK